MSSRIREAQTIWRRALCFLWCHVWEGRCEMPKALSTSVPNMVAGKESSR